MNPQLVSEGGILGKLPLTHSVRSELSKIIRASSTFLADCQISRLIGRLINQLFRYIFSFRSLLSNSLVVFLLRHLTAHSSVAAFFGHCASDITEDLLYILLHREDFWWIDIYLQRDKDKTWYWKSTFINPFLCRDSPCVVGLLRSGRRHGI